MKQRKRERDNNEAKCADEISQFIQEMLEWSRALLREKIFLYLHEEDKSRVEKYHANLSKLFLKSRSKVLNLAIIGEPYCGKSSFVNAFLDYSILPETEPGQKLALPIVFKSAPEPLLKLISKDGGESEYPCHNLAELCDLFKELLKKNLLNEGENLLCQGPFPALPPDYSLLKLPALDSMNEFSGTARLMASSCDVMLVLGHISRPLSLSLLKEINNLRGEKAENCIFIATACDLLGESDLKRMETYFFNRLQERFSTQPPFYFVSALAALEENLEEANNIYNYESFANFRKNLLQALEPLRTQLILSSSLRELETLNRELLETLMSIKVRFQEKLNTAIITSSEKRENKIYNIKIKFQEMNTRSFTLLECEVQELIENMCSILLHKLTESDDLTALKNFALKENPLLLEIFIRQLVKNLSQSFNEQIKRNIHRINFRFDLDCHLTEGNIPAYKFRDILEKGGEFAECKANLINITGQSYKQIDLYSKKNTSSWLSGLLDGIAAFSSTLFDKSRAEDFAQARKFFQDRIKYCFDCLNSRIAKDFKIFYDETLSRLEKELENILQAKGALILDGTKGENIKSMQLTLKNFEHYEVQLKQFFIKGSLLRQLLTKI